MEDIDYDELDPGIRETVRLLRKWGFETTDSGDGVSKKGTEQEPLMLQFPHVFMRSTSQGLITSAENLHRLMDHHGVSFDPDFEAERYPGIEATYSPTDGAAIILLRDIDDKTLEGSSC